MSMTAATSLFVLFGILFVHLCQSIFQPMLWLRTFNLVSMMNFDIIQFRNKQTRKRFSEKPIVAFTNSTVFILYFYNIYIYDEVGLVSCFGLECLDFDESSYNQLPGSLSSDYKYMHERQIPH